MKRSVIQIIGIGSLLVFFSGCTTPPDKAVDGKTQEEKDAAYNKWLGEKLFDDGEYEKAFEIWSVLAEQGYAESQFDLGVMYGGGLGVAQDYKKAVEWYRKAAEQGNDDAQGNLGVMYLQGQGVPKDDKKAFELFTKAVEQGDAEAQCNLGLMYDKGIGVPQDYEKAFEWYLKAAEQGDPRAQYNLGVIYYKGHGVPQDDNEAYIWIKLASEQEEKYSESLKEVSDTLSPDELSKAEKRYLERKAAIQLRQQSAEK